ncbi:hypothetical protein BHE74_00030213, partial [Ensete ventricosum]
YGPGGCPPAGWAVLAAAGKHAFEVKAAASSLMAPRSSSFPSVPASAYHPPCAPWQPACVPVLPGAPTATQPRHA